jgi:hypothetical protein
MRYKKKIRSAQEDTLGPYNRRLTTVVKAELSPCRQDYSRIYNRLIPMFTDLVVVVFKTRIEPKFLTTKKGDTFGTHRLLIRYSLFMTEQR